MSSSPGALEHHRDGPRGLPPASSSSGGSGMGARLRRLRSRVGHPPRRVVPTRAGLFALAAPLVLGLAAVNASNNLLFLLLGAALGAIVLSGVLSERNLRGVTVDVRAVGPVHAGEPARLLVTFQRAPWAAAEDPAYGLTVRERKGSVLLSGLRRYDENDPGLFVHVPLVAGESATRLGRRTFEARGSARLGPAELTTRYPFGLLVKARDVAVDVEVLVRPRRVPVPRALAEPRGLAADGDDAASRGLGFDLYGLREREERDSVHRVHARRSLALGFDVVIETDGVERPMASLGIANVRGADPQAFERALEVAQAVLMAWDERGFAVGLVTADRAYPPLTTSLEGLLDVLARLELVDASGPAIPAPLWIVPTGGRLGAEPAAIASVDARGEVALAAGHTALARGAEVRA